MANTAGGVLLTLLVFLSASVPCLAVYNSGECYFNTKGSCEYMGAVYGIGETWVTSDCYQCVCMEPFGVGCCDQGLNLWTIQTGVRSSVNLTLALVLQ